MMPDALGLLEVKSWTASMAALDAAEKAGVIRVLQVELNDLYGACVKITGDVADVRAAVEAGRERVEGLGKLIAAHVIPRPSTAVLGLIPKQQ